MPFHQGTKALEKSVWLESKPLLWKTLSAYFRMVTFLCSCQRYEVSFFLVLDF